MISSYRPMVEGRKSRDSLTGPRPLLKEFRAVTQEGQDLIQGPQRTTTSWLVSRPTSLRTVLSTVGWVLSHQLTIKKVPLHRCLHVTDLIEAVLHLQGLPSRSAITVA